MYGDNDDAALREKKTTFAGEYSKKEPTRAPVFDEKAAEERRMRELYGDAAYHPRAQNKPTDASTTEKYVANAKAMKGQFLQSHIMTHDDDNLR